MNQTLTRYCDKVGGQDMTIAQARRKEMHDKLDNWIDGVEE